MLADICAVGIVVVFIWLGYRSGLMKTLINVVSYIISIIISFFLYPAVSDLLIKTPLYTKFTEVITNEIQKNNIAESADGGVLGILSNYINRGVESATAGIAESMATMLVNILAFVIILILSKVLIRVVSNMLGILTRLPLIKQLNRLGGSVLGAVLGVMALYIISAVLVLTSPIDSQSRIYREIENSSFVSEIYENNVILNFLGKGQEGDNSRT